MSLVTGSKSEFSQHMNIATAKDALTEKLKEIIPVVKFYTEISDGWKTRVNLSNAALVQIPLADKRNQKVLQDLVAIAKERYAKVQKLLVEADLMRISLEEKLQDLHMFSLISGNTSEDGYLTFDAQEISRIIYQSDALLELKNLNAKELTL